MKSIKPGRGPSFMGGVTSIAVGIFGVVWTIIAAMLFWPFAIFGLVFVGIAIMQAVYHFKNATGKNRYSAFDIVDHTEEPDPLNQQFGTPTQEADSDGSFCPYCGAKAEKDFSFCNECGKKLPK